MHTTTLPRHARTGVLALGWRKARTGEDGPQPIWPILGAAEDDDPDDDPDPADDEPQDDPADDDPDEPADDDPDGADDLGDKGKQALDRMKAKLKAERDKRKAAEAERDQLKAGQGKDGQDPERIRSEAEQAATAKANARIVRSEVRAAAAGKLADPRDALRFLDLEQFEVDEDGQVDEDEVADAIDQLVKDKPYLAAGAGKPQPRFQGTGDGGARKGTGGPKQLTERDVQKMTPEQIDEAHRKGQLRDYLGG
jgi:hypothetical protein